MPLALQRGGKTPGDRFDHRGLPVKTLKNYMQNTFSLLPSGSRK